VLGAGAAAQWEVSGEGTLLLSSGRLAGMGKLAPAVAGTVPRSQGWIGL
jgi:hypothetical protein